MGDYLGIDAVSPEATRIRYGHGGKGYGQPTEEADEWIKLIARSQGILLDPVYSGKGFAGMMQDVASGQWTREDVVVFIHTGGLPGIFAYPHLCDSALIDQ